MRALILFGLLILVVAGAYLFQQGRFSRTSAASPPLASARPVPGHPGDLVLELGGGPPPAPVRPVLRAEAAPDDGAAAEEHHSDPGAREAIDAAPPAPQKPENVKKADKRDRADGAATIQFAKGDSLFSLAKKHYGSADPKVIRDLQTANHVADASKIREGSAFTLPAVAGGRKRLGK